MELQEQQNRLNALEQVAILGHFEEIEDPSIKSVCTECLKDVFSGAVDYIYSNDSVKDMDDAEKKSLFELVRKYQDLLFYDGKIELWDNSIRSESSEKLSELNCMLLLDDYDFLLDVVKDGGEAVLKFLSSLKNSGETFDGSIVNSIRSYYMNDQTLKTILLEMSKEDGLYSGFSPFKKATLFLMPYGTLLKETDEGYEMIPVEQLDALQDVDDSQFVASVWDYTIEYEKGTHSISK